MKAIYYPILRIVLTLLVGGAMIAFPGNVLSYIAIVVGLLFIIPGAIELLRYLIIYFRGNRRDRRNNPMRFPVIATLSIIAGIVVIAFSSQFIQIFALLLAVALIIAGGYEIIMIARSEVKNMVGFYIMPALLALLGIFILANPLDLLPNLIVIMFGVGAIIYAINEIVYLARIAK